MASMTPEEVDSLCKLIRAESIAESIPLKVAAITMTIKLLEDVVVEAMRELFPSHGEMTDVALNVALNFASMRITEAALGENMSPSQFLDVLEKFIIAFADSTIRRTIDAKRSQAKDSGAAFSESEMESVAGMAKDIISKVMH